MKAHFKARPKFPRQRKRPKVIFLALSVLFLFLVVLLLLNGILAKDIQANSEGTTPLPVTASADSVVERTKEREKKSEPLSKAPQISTKTRQEVTKVKNVNQKEENIRKTSVNEPFTFNLAGITAKKKETPDPTNDEQSSKSAKNISIVINKEEASSREVEKQIDPTQQTTTLKTLYKENDPRLPRPYMSNNIPPLYAAESTMWKQPFVGFGLDEIGDFFLKRYGKMRPTQWISYGKGITSKLTNKHSSPVIVLTIDACGERTGEGYDEKLISFLVENKIPATLFVSSKWISSNRKVFKNLSAQSNFEIGGHGVEHKPLSASGKSINGIKGTMSIEDIVTEVEANVREIHRQTRKRPKWFRSAAGYYDDIAIHILDDLALGIAGYSILVDGDKATSARDVEGKILSAQDGDILLLHLSHSGEEVEDGAISAISKLLEKGYVFKSLSDAVALNKTS